MKLYLYPNYTHERYYPILRAVAETLTGQGHECAMPEDVQKAVFGQRVLGCFAPEEGDMVVSVGGDGTLLRAGQVALAADKPLCGINAGRLGHLCAYRWDGLAQFSPERFAALPLLECTDGSGSVCALNDAVIGKDYFGGTVDIAFSVNGGAPRRFRGDGLIVSTPLGSTGYTVSAGGTVLESGCGCFAVTPICPHSGDGAPLVVRDTDTVSVTLMNPAYTASLFIDGRKRGGFSACALAKSARTLKLAVR